MKLETDDYIVEFQLTEALKDRLLEKVIDFFTEHECFNGESIIQSDGPQIGAAPLLADIADDVFKFDIKWKEDWMMSETCADCKYYKPDEATWYFNGWGETPSTGRCFLEPLPAPGTEMILPVCFVQ